MNMTLVQQKKVLAILLAVLVLLSGYRLLTADKPRTAPLTYTRGAVARSSVRAVHAGTAGSDSLQAFLARREEKYPGVRRDLFRMENPEAAKPRPVIKSAVTPTIPAPPPVPEKTPEEIAADAARADLSRFRFLGFLTDKESSLFLSKDGETFIVRSGDSVLKSYRVKEAGRDYVVLIDSVTRVEARIELSGGAEQAAPQQRSR